MKKYLTIQFVFFLSIFWNSCHLQKHDNTWLFGYYPVDSTHTYGGTWIDFQTKTMLFFEPPIWFKGASSMYSDNSGHLVAYTNGCEIYDSAHHIIQNGDSLNPGYFYTNGFCHGRSNYYPGSSNGSLFIPRSDTSISLFHLRHDTADAKVVINTLLVSDIEFRNNSIQVITKNNELLHGSFMDYVFAVKHANGRDWWLIVQDFEQGYYTILLTENGIYPGNKQLIGKKWNNMYWSGQAVFSPDGSKFIRTNPFNDATIFDFDRCNGLLSNPVYISFPTDTAVSSGCSISPNNRYLYISQNKNLYQFDLKASDIPSSIQHIDRYDEFRGPEPTKFYQMSLAPDGKIYMTSTASANTLHTIHKPNENGKACDFRQHDFKLLTRRSFFIPKFPNYRLGPIDGSICDSLGINNLPVANWRADQDTFNFLKFEFTDLSSYEVEEWYWDFGDGHASRDTNPIHTFSQNGVYEVCLIVKNKNGADTLCRTITIGTVSTKDNDKKIIDIQVWPNPCKDFLIINVLDYNPQKMILQLFNSIGEKLISKKLYQGSNFIEVDYLNIGLYFISIQENGKEIKNEKIIK